MVIPLKAIQSKTPYLAVTWQVNNFCNFKCSYCNSGNWSGSHINDDNLDLYIGNLKKIVAKYKDHGYKDFKFFFSGGEPSVWANLIPICEWIHSEVPNACLAINTNLSRSLAWWEKHHTLFDDVVASFHIEYANRQRYLEVSNFLCDKVNYLSNKMLMHDEKFWEVVEVGEIIKKTQPNYFLEWTPLFDEMSVNAGPWHYDDPKKVEWLAAHSTEMNFTVPKPAKRSNSVSYAHWEDSTITPVNSNEIIIKGQNFFKGWQCNVGDAIFINPRGHVSMASCGQGQDVGHILSNIDYIGPQTITCNKDHCHCGTDITIPKYSPK